MPEPRKNTFRTEGVRRGEPFYIEVDGRDILTHHGESVLGALWATGIRALRLTPKTKEPRGFFCGMGACFDCLVTVNGIRNTRACLEPVAPNMSVQIQRDADEADLIGSSWDAPE